MARIPVVAYPAAFIGSLALGRFIRAGDGAGTEAPASDVPTADQEATTDAGDWAGYGDSGLQFPPGGGPGVLPAPIDDSWWYEPPPDTPPVVFLPNPTAPTTPTPTPAPAQPSPSQQPAVVTVSRPTSAPPSGAVGWAWFPAGLTVYDVRPSSNWTGAYPVEVVGPRTASSAGSRWVSGTREARIWDGRLGRSTLLRRITGVGSSAWLNTFAVPSGYAIFPAGQATAPRPGG